MNSAVQNLAISLGVMQLARRIPFDNPQVLLAVRVAYVVTQVVVLGVYYYISTKVCAGLRYLSLHELIFHKYQIKAKNDQTVLKYGLYP